MAYSFSFIGKVWYMSGKHLVKIPEEYWAMLDHDQEVQVEVVLDNDRYVLPGKVKKYQKGVFVKLPPHAQALKHYYLRIKVHVQVRALEGREKRGLGGV